MNKCTTLIVSPSEHPCKYFDAPRLDVPVVSSLVTDGFIQEGRTPGEGTPEISAGGRLHTTA